MVRVYTGPPRRFVGISSRWRLRCSGRVTRDSERALRRLWSTNQRLNTTVAGAQADCRVHAVIITKQMPIEQVVSLLIAECDRLSRAIDALQGPARRGRPRATPSANSTPAASAAAPKLRKRRLTRPAVKRSPMRRGADGQRSELRRHPRKDIARQAGHAFM